MMKGQSERKIGAPLSRGKKTLRIPLIVYGWIFLVSLLGGILFYVSIYYVKVKPSKEGLHLPVRDILSMAHGIRSDQQMKVPTNNVLTKETLILSTKAYGDIHIVLRPDLSSESVAFIHEMAKLPACPNCNFYRAEQRILQGIMKSDDVQKVQKKGTCPPEYRGKKQECFKGNKDCDCHGPTMTKGMVGWAGGGTGQDFFIESYDEPTDWWGQQHTVWGEIKDSKSQEVVDSIFKLPTHVQGMVMLDDKIPFELKIVQC